MIGGHDISTDIHLARNMTGFCPQENVYYKFLTIREHLQLFHDLKSALREGNDGHSVEDLIELLDIKSDLNKEAFKLSGGTMRRLVLGMALIGPNDVLLLDEPTAGLDPKVRRKVWDLIINERNSKSVVITSHHLEEANLLSDMIVIIAKGEIKFKGSTLKMKKDFNSGYHLKIVKNAEMKTESEITKIISKYAKIKNYSKHDMRDNEELQYELDFKDSERFSEMFDELELKTNSLAINNLSLGVKTFEDSYARIIHRKDDSLNLENSIQMDESNDSLLRESIRFERTEQNYFKLFVQQIIGILFKRLNYLSKHYILFLTLILIPIFFISLLFLTIEVAKHVLSYKVRPIVLKSEEIYGYGKKSLIITNQTQFEKSISNTYSSYLSEKDIQKIDFDNDNIQESLLLYSEKSLLNYFHNLLYGLSTYMTNETTNLIVWNNYGAYHSLPISINLMTNSLLRHLTNDNSYEITVVNSPLQTDNYGNDLYNHHNYLILDDYFTIDLILFMFGFTFTSASYVLLPIKELRTKFKLLQLMSGLNPIIYWFANFVFDFTLHAICCLIYASVYHVLDYYEFFIASKYSFISIYILFLLYGFSFIPFAYLISFFSKKPSTGFAFLSLYNIIGGTITILLITILYFIFSRHEKPIYYLISESLLILCPNALFLTGVNTLHRILGYNTYCHIRSRIKNLCSSIGDFYCCQNSCSDNTEFNVDHFLRPYYIIAEEVPKYYGCYKWFNPISYVNSFYLRFIAYGLIYFLIILFIEMKYYQKIFRIFKKSLNHNKNEFELQESEPQGVRQESQQVSQLVRSGAFNSEALIVDKLTKVFKKSLIVPNKLSFAVHKEECFGLLGINGSGKTTTFRLLTGDLSISSGNAYLDSNTNLLTNKIEFYSRIGYCPQNDALLDRLTGMQTLKLFGRLRGLESNAFNNYIKNIIEKFELKNIINKRLSTYSGGNRRKLSLAIALIGNPSLLLLDEPTNGVDPDSRLRIWQLLRDLLINCKTSILLTSHNMEECEALCSRLAIMSNGVLKTIGFISDIKKIYAKGFTLILKVNLNCDQNIVEELKSKVYETFGYNCILKYENFGVIYYHLNSENIKLSQIFGTLDTLKTEFQLEDYYVSNASLEQAFLSIIGQTNQ